MKQDKLAAFGVPKAQPNPLANPIVAEREEIGRDRATHLIKWTNLFEKAQLFCYLAWHGRQMPRPFYAHFQITRRCNFRCGSCQTWRDTSFAKGLSLEEMELAGRNLRRVGVKCIVLSGGEPTLRKDIVDIVHTFRKCGLIVRLQTNGFLLTEDLLERLFRAGVADIYISFDSLNESTFNAINGIDRSDGFQRVTAGIEAAARLGKLFGAGIFLTAVLRKGNMEEVEALRRFAKAHGVLIGFYGMEIPASDSQINIRSADPAMAHTQDDRKRLKEVFEDLIAIREMPGASLSVSRRLLEDYRDYFGSLGTDMHWDCRAGRIYIELLPDGAVSVCNATSPIKDLNYRNLVEFYNSPNIEPVLQERRQSCDGCICTRQLEYMVGDRADLLEKAWSYGQSLFKRGGQTVRDHG